MAESVSKVVKAPGASIPFSIESILVDKKGGRYVGTILPISLADLVAERWSVNSGASKGNIKGNGGNNKPLPKVDAKGGPTQVQVRYEVHLPSLYLCDGDKLRSILVGTVLPTLNSHVLCKNRHLCRVCWEECKRKNSRPRDENSKLTLQTYNKKFIKTVGWE